MNIRKRASDLWTSLRYDGVHTDMSDTRKHVDRIAEALAAVERETWEAAAVAVGGSGGGRSAYSYRDEFLQNASLCIQDNQAGLNAPQTVPVASNSGVNGGRERADLPDTAEMLKEAYIVLNDVVHTAPGYNWNKDPLSLTLKVGNFNQKYYDWQKQSESASDDRNKDG